MRSRSRARRSAEPSHALTFGGSGPATNWPAAPTLGGSQKGAETRPERPGTHRGADARRDDHHGDSSALLLLRPYRRAGPGADHGEPLQAHPPRGVGFGQDGYHFFGPVGASSPV